MYQTISTDGVVERHEGIPDLDKLYEHTRSQTVQAVSLHADDEPFTAVMWMDEEYGYRPEQVRNDLATKLVERFSPDTLIGFGGIGGPIVLTGGADDEGETEGLSESWANRIDDFAAELSGQRQTV